jgi:hypothetical protein
VHPPVALLAPPRSGRRQCVLFEGETCTALLACCGRRDFGPDPFRVRTDDSSPTVLALFERALELQKPHNVFAAWMVTPMPNAGGRHPMDLLARKDRLLLTLGVYARNN